MAVPGLTLAGGNAGPSDARNSGGNQSVQVNGASSLPSSFWGSPAVFDGGTSIIPGTGKALTTSGIFFIAACGFALWYLTKK